MSSVSKKYPPRNEVFDWLFVCCSGIATAGVFIDGWAHIHLESELESFFTPWHVVFYFGLGALALLLAVGLYQNHLEGFSWRRSLPREYVGAAYGIALVFIGGPGDALWHSVFGIEAGIEALLSPTHLLLALGSVMAISAPFRAIWLEDREPDARQSMRAVLSLTYVLLAISFMLQFLHPISFPWMAESFAEQNPMSLNFNVALGIGGAIVFTAMLVGSALLTVRRWKFPFGSFSALLTCNALALTLMRGAYYEFISTTLLAGIIIDTLYAKLCVLPIRSSLLRWFGFFAPTSFFLLYALTILLFDNTLWSSHMWVGMICIAGVIGYLITHLAVAPYEKTP